MSTVESLLQLNMDVDLTTFEAATQRWSARHDLHALGVLTRLHAQDLAAFESQLAAERAPSPQVRSATGDGGVRPYVPGEPAFVIRLIAPRGRNAQVLGVNSYANPNVAPVIDRALAEGEPRSTRPFPLRVAPESDANAPSPVQGVVVYQRIGSLPDGGQRVAFATLRLDQILPTVQPPAASELLACLRTAGEAPGQVVASSGPGACAQRGQGLRHVQRTIGFAGQEWLLEVGQHIQGAEASDGVLVQELALGCWSIVAMLMLATTGGARLYERAALRARAAQASAQAAHRAKADFLDRLRHDVRTPLNAMLGLTQILRQEPPKARDLDAWLERIEHAGLHLRDMLDELVNASAADTGQLDVRDACLPLAPLVTSSIEVTRQAWTSVPSVTWIVDSVPSSWQVLGDARRIRQVLVNLLSNAVKYNRPGGQLRLIATADPDEVKLQVQDDGIGMSAEQLSRLFRPFDRLGRESSGVEGTGLGLFLSRQFVERMGGRLEVTSAPERGTVFTLVLRRGPDAVVSKTAQPAELRILAVEDDPTAALILQSMAARRGAWRLTLLEGVHGAEDTARSVRPDVILLDGTLPDGSGRDLLARLKADPLLSPIPVLMISGETGPPPPEAHGCFSKPWSLPELEVAIEAAGAARNAARSTRPAPGFMP